MIKYKTALILILRYILAAIATCDQAIFFFFFGGGSGDFFFLAGGISPRPKKKNHLIAGYCHRCHGCLLSFLLLTAVLAYTVIGRIARG